MIGGARVHALTLLGLTTQPINLIASIENRYRSHFSLRKRQGLIKFAYTCHIEVRGYDADNTAKCIAQASEP